MANCKKCKTNIPDGEEYCKDCLEETNAKANESYLDGLLNSVQESAPTADSIYMKRNTIDSEETDEYQETKTDFQDDEIFNFDIGDIEDFDQFDMNGDLNDIQDDSSINDKDLFGEDFTDFLSGIDSNDMNNSDNANADLTKDESVGSPIKQSEEEENNHIAEDTISADNINDVKSSLATDSGITNNISTNEINDFTEDDSYDTDLNSILNQLDEVQSDHEEANAIPVESLLNNNDEASDTVESSDQLRMDSELDLMAEESNQEDDNQIDEDDFLSLLNQIDQDDPVADDVKAITDLMSGIPVESPMEPGMPSDVGEVFSDALKGISNLNDPHIDENELLKDKKAKKEKKKKKSKKADKALDTQDSEDKPKIGFFKRLFGNVEDKNASKKNKTPISIEGIENTENVEVKKAKPKKGKKGKAAASENDNESEGSKKGQKKNEAAENKKAKKAKKKEKKPKTTDVIQVIDEIEEDTGRINRLGASIVFVFFGLLALLIYAGSNAVTYTLSIQHATTYFNDQKYTQAYDEVYGMKIEDDDVEIYSKIMTVMFVNKQLNSYNNYCSYKDYPKALDSLLKGLKRYDKYIELATILGIKNDMNYVREQIIAELKNKFNLSEKDALRIMNINNKEEYSLQVYDVVQTNK